METARRVLERYRSTGALPNLESDVQGSAGQVEREVLSDGGNGTAPALSWQPPASAGVPPDGGFANSSISQRGRGSEMQGASTDSRQTGLLVPLIDLRVHLQFEV